MKKPTRSRSLFARATAILPGGVDSPVRAFKSVGGSPLFIKRASGAVIEDVEPNGRSTYVTDGRLRASWRSLAEPAWDNSDANWHRGLAQDLAALEEGVPAEMVFDFFPIAYTFKAGHRIRIALTTSIGEAYQQPPSANGIAPSGVLLADTQHPSAIDLPLSSGR